MAGADGKIHIDTEIDKSGIKYDAKDIEREMENMGKRISKTSERYNNQMTKNYEYYGRSVRRVYRGQSEEARRMHSEMRSAYMEQRQSLYKYKDQLIGSKYAFFQLGKAAKDYTGTSKQFMGQVEAQGRAHKKVMDDMIKNNEMMKVQLIQSVGQMIVRTTQATRIMENFDRMKNPLYQVNKGALAVASGLNQIAMRGQPAALALKMLGPTANMKQLRDMTMMISQGIMRMTMVALVATVTAAKFYTTLHKGAMESNKQYAKAFAGMKKSVRQAFEPLFQVFAAVMIPVFNFIKKIADLTTEFNKAHPKIAKFVAAVLLLIPALMLILAPLAAGIGLIAGFQAALGAAWMIIGPLITGLAAMSGTVWLVAAGIVGIVVAFKHFNKEGQPLNNLLKKISASLGTMGSLVKALFAGNAADINKFSKQLQNVFGEAIITRIVKFGTSVRASIISAMKTFDMLGQKAMQTGLVVGGMVKAFFTNNTKEMANMNKQLHNIFPPSIADGIFNSLVTVLQGIDKLRMGIVAVAKVATGSFSSFSDLDKYLQGTFGEKGTALIMKFGNVIKSVFASLGSIFEDFKNKVGAIWKAIQTAFSGGGFEPLINEVKDLIPSLIAAIVGGLPGLIIAGASMIEKILQGMGTSLPELINKASDIINSLILKIGEHLPKLIKSGAEILTNIINGIMSILPTLITIATNIIKTLISAITPLIPILLEAGVSILKALIEGIVTILPSLIDMALEIIVTLVEALLPLLPFILQSGIDILLALMDGIVEVLPMLLDAALEIIMAIFDALIDNLPKIIDAGMKILIALIDGISKILPKLISAAFKLIVALAGALRNNMPQITEAGKKILWALVKGVASLLWELVKLGAKLVWEMIKGVSNTKRKMMDAAIDTVKGAFNSAVSWVSSFFGIGKSIGDQMAAGMDAAGRVVGNAAAGLAKTAMSAAKINMGSFGGAPDGSHKLGLDYVPFDGYVAELHKGERVLTADEARLYNAQEQSGSFGNIQMPDMSKIRMPNMATAFSGMTPATVTAAPSPTTVEQPISITFTGNIIVRNDDDIPRIAEELGSKINRDRRRLDR
ncbi:phage tail protein [Listeria newyorkensis]|uniref:Phage-related protein n=1 Tax=Listeria newyorkensis TaxID=1497681 RepID=A0A841Z2K1_9LIST|nr:hypothetical protein [Listeria newyorkensis]MBC1459077.1 hypothetical protein [Listeria newyorkensis]